MCQVLPGGMLLKRVMMKLHLHLQAPHLWSHQDQFSLRPSQLLHEFFWRNGKTLQTQMPKKPQTTQSAHNSVSFVVNRNAVLDQDELMDKQLLVKAEPKQDGGYAVGRRKHFEEFAATVQSLSVEGTHPQLVKSVHN